MFSKYARPRAEHINRPHSHRLSLKVFSDASGAMWKKNVKDVEGEVLCVSQFTLFANTSKGNKPDFHRAMVSAFASFRVEYYTHGALVTLSLHRLRNPLDKCTTYFWIECVHYTVLIGSKVRRDLATFSRPSDSRPSRHPF